MKKLITNISFSSNENSTNIIWDQVNSKLKLILSPPLILQGENKIRCVRNSVWWSFPNFQNILGNEGFHFIYNNVNYDIVLQSGIYSLYDIVGTIENFLINNNLPSTMILLEGNEAIQKISINVNVNQPFFLDPMQANNQQLVNKILGFTIPISNANGNLNTWYQAENVARFNRMNQIKVHCDIINSGYGGSVDGDNTLCNIAIPQGTSPNSQIITQYLYPKECKINKQNITEINFYLTNEKDTSFQNLEPWSLELEIYQ